MITNNDKTEGFTGLGQYANTFQDSVSKGYNVDVYGDIYLNGYFYILFTRLPEFMKEEMDNLGDFKEMTRVLYNAVELPGRQLTFTEVTTSFGGASRLPIPTGIQTGQDLAISYNELSGLPMIRMHERWLTGIRDPISGISDIKDYGIKNYTGDLLYITTKPVHYGTTGSYGKATGSAPNKQIIESAHFFKNVMPENDPQELLSSSIEQSDKINVRINYKFANMFTGPHARQFAVNQLDYMCRVKDIGGYEVDPTTGEITSKF